MKKVVRKKKSAAKKVKKQPTVMDTLPRNHGEYLELLIKMTERVIRPGISDMTMTNQAIRLKAELAKWKSENSK